VRVRRKLIEKALLFSGHSYWTSQYPPGSQDNVDCDMMKKGEREGGNWSFRSSFPHLLASHFPALHQLISLTLFHHNGNPKEHEDFPETVIEEGVMVMELGVPSTEFIRGSPFVSEKLSVRGYHGNDEREDIPIESLMEEFLSFLDSFQSHESKDHFEFMRRFIDQEREKMDADTKFHLRQTMDKLQVIIEELKRIRRNLKI